MGQIIHVDFHKCSGEISPEQVSSGESWLHYLQQNLADDDMEDVLAAIMDRDYYHDCDQVVQQLVDVYFGLENGV